jgi:predicted TIM-barrel fold metal-dependent hydrolase
MKVRELIEKLKEMDPEKPVVYASDGSYWPLTDETVQETDIESYKSGKDIPAILIGEG